jgi:hypothetical protein
MAESGPESTPGERTTAIEWACLAAGLVLTLQYSWLLDDAFIYYRYVDNLVLLGRGLVFNQGEYVEGFSSPAWTLLLIPLRALGLDWWLAVRVIGLASFAATWRLLVLLDRELAPRGGPRLNLPALFLSFNYAVLTYFTSGVESPLVQLAAAAYALYLVKPGSRAAQALVALSPLIRHELALPLAIAAVFVWRSTRRFPRVVVALCAATVGAWIVFRVAYYADLFPNTFYLKDELEVARGLAYVHDTCIAYGVYALLPALAALAIGLVRTRERIAGGARLALLGCAAAVALYVVKIGGDPRHYRYLAFPFCALVCASGGLVERAIVRTTPRAAARAAPVVALVVALGTFAMYPRQLARHPLDRAVEHQKVDEINDAQYHRLKPDLGFSPWTLADVADQVTAQEAEFIYPESSPLALRRPTSVRAEYARYLAADPRPVAERVSTDGWCVRMFKRFVETLVHYDGLTDPVLARTRAESWRAGHKRDLHPLGAELAALRTRFGSRRGAFRAAVEAGAAPGWIAANLDALEVIERKAYNRRDLFENLALAFAFPPRIEPSAP